MFAPEWGRRAFLARMGLLTAATTSGVFPAVAGTAAARPTADPVADVDTLLQPVLAELAWDTMTGLAVFACPGPDPYSIEQGTPRTRPGAVQAQTPRFLIETLDNFVPMPDELLRPAMSALATGTSDAGIPLPARDESPLAIRTLDEALTTALRNDATLPLSGVVSALLNLVATTVRPTAVLGPFSSPFARLSFAEKTKVFATIEAPAADLVSALDVRLPQPLRASLSGLLRFLGGALLEFASFGAYCEFAVFDPETKQLRERPVGWQLTGYQPDGPVEGWDEFLGYYQGRQEVHD